jgi:hypothetical protein
MQGGRYTEDALRRLVRDNKEIWWLDARGVPPHVNGPSRTRRTIPSDAHRVPLVAPTATPLVVGGFNRVTRDRRRWFAAVRALLASSGAGDLDERIIGYRWAVETAWDRACQQRNRGNVKGQGRITCESWSVFVGEQRVWIDIPEATGVYGLTDRVSSADLYPAFSSDADYVRYFVRVLGRFGDALVGARRGGLEGAQQFERALARGGYSPAAPDAAVAEVSGYWRSCARLIGAQQWEARQWA